MGWVGTPLTVGKTSTGTKEEALFNILKGRSFSFRCALRTQEEDSPCGRIHFQNIEEHLFFGTCARFPYSQWSAHPTFQLIYDLAMGVVVVLCSEVSARVFLIV